jgi:hypothetical protein
MGLAWTSGCLLPILLLLWQDPDDVHPVDGKKRCLEENLPSLSQDADICNGDEFIIQVELILDALVPADVNIAAQQMGCRLYRRVNGPFGNYVGKSFAFFIIFNRHISSSLLAWDNLTCRIILPAFVIKIATKYKCRYRFHMKTCP